MVAHFVAARNTDVGVGDTEPAAQVEHTPGLVVDSTGAAIVAVENAAGSRRTHN